MVRCSGVSLADSVATDYIFIVIIEDVKTRFLSTFNIRWQDSAPGKLLG